MNFSLRMKQLREQKNLTQMSFAKIFNISYSTVGMWESDNRIPPAPLLIKIANYFNVSVDYLLGNTDNPNIESSPSPAPNTVIAFGRGGERKEFVLNDAEADAVTAMLEALRSKKN